jgi:hypothetical protein
LRTYFESIESGLRRQDQEPEPVIIFRTFNRDFAIASPLNIAMSYHTGKQAAVHQRLQAAVPRKRTVSNSTQPFQISTNLPGTTVFLAQTRISPKLRPVADTQGWYLGYAGAYFWLSPYRILALRDVHAGLPIVHKEPDGAFDVKWLKPYGGAFQVFDVTSGLTTPLPRLTALFDSEHGLVATLRVSPDGRWIYWRGNRGATVMHLDGSQRWASAPTDPVQWMNHQRLAQYRPGPEGRIAAGALYERFASHPIRQHNIDVAASAEDGDTLLTDHHLIVIDWHSVPSSEAGILSQRLERAADGPERYPVPWPDNEVIREVQFSPQGSRIAWLVEVLSVPGKQNGTETVTQELWVTTTTGAGKTLILRHSAVNKRGLHHLRWLPDGTQLSVVCNDNLYTVTANGTALHHSVRDRHNLRIQHT